MSKRICIVGNVTIDDVVVPPATVRFGLPGGNAAYAALGARVWGQEGDCVVSIVSIVGDDCVEQIGALAHLGIDVSAITVDPGPSIRNWVLYTVNGERQFVLQISRERRDLLCPDVDHLPEDINAYDLVHVAGLPPQYQERVLRRLADSAATTQMDLGEVDRDVTLRALRNLDVFLPSLVEFRELVGAETCVKRGIRSLGEFGPNHVVLKLGKDGVLVYTKKQDVIVAIPACEVHEMDATGAGDAFCGGFAAGWLRTRDAVSAAMHGIVSASFAVEGYGLEGLITPDVEVVADRLRRLQDGLRHERRVRR